VLEADEPSEQDFETEWSARYGAVLLANIDDDDRDGRADAEDDVVNGPEDLADLARIRVAPAASVPDGAEGVVSVDARSAAEVRVFRVDRGTLVSVDPRGHRVSAAELRSGVELAIEAKGFARSLEQGAWTGFVDIHLDVRAGGAPLGSDDARMRVAPLVLTPPTFDAERVWVGGFDEGFVQGLRAATIGAAVPVHVLRYDAPGYVASDVDQWTQDHFEMGYAAMPAAGGAHRMTVAMRTARPNRTSADVVFLELRGPDFGAVHVHAQPYDETTRSLDSMGNLDTVPPHVAHGVAYPLGRLVVGSTPGRSIDAEVRRFLEAQRVQPLLEVDTSWLAVGHVDEILAFVRADAPRGWRMLFASPALARRMLEDAAAQGNGDAVLFAGKWWWGGPAERSVQEILDDADLMALNQHDQALLDDIRERLASELDLGDGEVTPMPFLEHEYEGLSVGYQPATVNLLAYGHHVLMPLPFGPVVGGTDLFVRDLESRLPALGLVPHWVDDWDSYHRNNGEVHCATNVLRRVPAKPRWWESGR
jgi:protein-arginine deiminase